MARPPIDKDLGRGDPRMNKNAIIDRSQFLSQLYDKNGKPTRVMYEFCGRMDKEAGDLGPEGRMAWAETVFNRCASRGNTIDYELRNHGNYSYWPKFQPQPGYLKNKEYEDIIGKVCKNGTNLTCGATGNACLGVGVGRVTHKVKYERFGIETPDNSWWNTKFGKAIMGVGKFIGDVASVVGTVARGVVNAVGTVGRSIGNAVSGAFHRNDTQPHQPVQPHHQQGEPMAQVDWRKYSQYPPPAALPPRPVQPGRYPYVNAQAPHSHMPHHDHQPSSSRDYLPRS